MAFHFSPRVVRDSSLVLYLDAANTKSYSGTGNTWTDLSSKLNNGTLYNSGAGLTFSSDNYGAIAFDGSDDYVGMTNSSTLKPDNITLSAWIKPGITNKTQFIFDGGYYNSIAGYLLYTNGANQFQFWIRNSSNNTQGVGVRTVTSTTIFNTTNWYNVTGIFDGSTVYIYVNGVLENSAAMSNPITYNNSGKFWIGNYASLPDATLAFQGNVSQIIIYNRALNNTEILQNYNAMKTRYGL